MAPLSRGAGVDGYELPLTSAVVILAFCVVDLARVLVSGIGTSVSGTLLGILTTTIAIPAITIFPFLASISADASACHHPSPPFKKS